MTSRAPMAVARAGVALAVRPLPTEQDRNRYRQEFLAQLHDMSAAGQLRFVLGVISQAFVLRTALGSFPSRTEEAAMTVTKPKPSWQCRIGHHHWVRRSTEDGQRYRTCDRCGRDHSGSPPDGGGKMAMIPGG